MCSDCKSEQIRRSIPISTPIPIRSFPWDTITECRFPSISTRWTNGMPCRFHRFTTMSNMIKLYWYEPRRWRKKDYGGVWNKAKELVSIIEGLLNWFLQGCRAVISRQPCKRQAMKLQWQLRKVICFSLVRLELQFSQDWIQNPTELVYCVSKDNVTNICRSIASRKI